MAVREIEVGEQDVSADNSRRLRSSPKKDKRRSSSKRKQQDNYRNRNS